MENHCENLTQGKHLSEIIHFGDQQVFEGATNYTCLLFLSNSEKEEFKVVKVKNLEDWRRDLKGIEGIIASNKVTGEDWNFVIGKEADLFSKLNNVPLKLADVTSRIFQGIKTSADKIYIVEEIERKANKVKVYSREKECEYWLEPDLLHPLIKGGDSRRYCISRKNRLIEPVAKPLKFFPNLI